MNEYRQKCGIWVMGQKNEPFSAHVLAYTSYQCHIDAVVVIIKHFLMLLLH